MFFTELLKELYLKYLHLRNNEFTLFLFHTQMFHSVSASVEFQVWLVVAEVSVYQLLYMADLEDHGSWFGLDQLLLLLSFGK